MGALGNSRVWLRSGSSLVLALVLASVVSAEPVKPTEKPLLWEITHPMLAQASYVYGTIHVPDKRVVTLPPVLSAALHAADEINTEIPMDMSTQMSMVPRLMNEDGKTLKEILPEELHARLTKYMQGFGMPMAQFERFRPWAVAAQLVLMDYLQELATVGPLDQQLWRIAQEADKELGALETVEEQISVFESLTPEAQIKFLKMTLDQIETGRDEQGRLKVLERMVVAYLEGDLKNLAAVAMEQYDTTDPDMKKFYDRLIVHRNKLMSKRMIEKMRKQGDRSYFFAVGALHLPESHGVLESLDREGFTLKRLTPADAARVKKIADGKSEARS